MKTRTVSVLEVLSHPTIMRIRIKQDTGSLITEKFLLQWHKAPKRLQLCNDLKHLPSRLEALIRFQVTHVQLFIRLLDGFFVPLE